MPTLMEDQSRRGLVAAGARSDFAVIEAVHNGESEACAVLRERYYGTALAVVRTCVGTEQDAESIASAALDRIERIIRNGQGPRTFLGPFVVWMAKRETEGAAGPVSLPDDPSDPSCLLRAFTGLPARWQQFLWEVHILGMPAESTAAALGDSTAGAVSVAQDASMGLRHAYRQAATGVSGSTDCRSTAKDMADFVRGTLPHERKRQIQHHLDACTRCTANYLCRLDPGTGLQTWLLPVLAGMPLWDTAAQELITKIRATPMPLSAAELDPTTDARYGRRMRSLLGAGVVVTAIAVTAVSLYTPDGPDLIPRQAAAELLAPSNEDTNRAAAQAGTRAATGDKELPDTGPTQRSTVQSPAGTGEQLSRKDPESSRVAKVHEVESAVVHDSAATEGDLGGASIGDAAEEWHAEGGEGVEMPQAREPRPSSTTMLVPATTVEPATLADHVPPITSPLLSDASIPTPIVLPTKLLGVDIAAPTPFTSVVPSTPDQVDMSTSRSSVSRVPSGPAAVDAGTDEKEQDVRLRGDETMSEGAENSSTGVASKRWNNPGNRGDSHVHRNENRSFRGYAHYGKEKNSHSHDKWDDSER
ncbi:zf-HC2 domain-containing protein [Kocuria rosea]|uniref:zf-HC2 domain-containing protein n=1 Tax=Kocuria rosea TaxID=1275 RepID=UPI00203BFD36|nr:zf-HC2 domain-containing protein [Kocuria rosea]